MTIASGAGTGGGLRGTTLRVERPTDDLVMVVRFYRDGLGPESIDLFEDDDGIDGATLLSLERRTTWRSRATAA